MPMPVLLPRTLRTQWRFRSSEGLDAIAFLGPLSGKPFYAEYYESELRAFKPRLNTAVLAAIKQLFAEADAAGYLLWPQLALVLSGGDTDTIGGVLAGLADVGHTLKPHLAQSPYWSDETWAQFEAAVPNLKLVLTGLRDAGFADFRRSCYKGADARVAELTSRFATLDIIAELERLCGRAIDPQIELNLLWFCRPHGVKIQGQRFIAQAEAADAVLVLTAAHEPLHPPFDMNGAVATRCLAVLGADPLLQRILREKDKDTGYNSTEGLFEEGVVQALDQLAQERFGFGKAPGVRWRQSDEGMHVVAAGVYGLLTADHYGQTGGHFETWLGNAASAGRLAPAVLHAAAARVREQRVDQLWPPPPPG